MMAPSKIAESGLKPREMAACVGVIICNALPQQYIIITPPGIINIAKAQVQIRLFDKNFHR